VPAYVILHDKTLHELAARRPASADELLDVPGIGQAKAERYGAEVLEIVAAMAIAWPVQDSAVFGRRQF